MIYIILTVYFLILIYQSKKNPFNFSKENQEIEFSGDMIHLPLDVEERINFDFLNAKDRDFVKEELLILVNDFRLSVGVGQLSRSILFLANGDINKFKEVILFDDDRDVLVEAENKNGNPGHYFSIPFQ